MLELVEYDEHFAAGWRWRNGRDEYFRWQKAWTSGRASDSHLPTRCHEYDEHFDSGWYYAYLDESDAPDAPDDDDDLSFGPVGPIVTKPLGMKRAAVAIRGGAVMLTTQETKLYDCGAGVFSLAEFSAHGLRRIPSDDLALDELAIRSNGSEVPSQLPAGDGDGRWYTLPAGGRCCVGYTLVSLM